jgi:hypothetical protein
MFIHNLLICFIVVSCQNNSFETEIIKSLSTGNYDFIINNSESDIAERLRSLSYNQNIFKDKIKIIRKGHLYENRYELILQEKGGRIIGIQYKKNDNLEIIYHMEISVDVTDVVPGTVLGPDRKGR